MLFIKRFKLIDVLFQKLSGRKAWKECLIWTIHFTPFVGNMFVCGSVSHETRKTLNTVIKLLIDGFTSRFVTSPIWRIFGVNLPQIPLKSMGTVWNFAVIS